MSPQALSPAEQRALEATKLQAFSGINLTAIRTAVAEMTSLIGREHLFSEYTLHDISHVDAMLRLAEWLVPNDTKKIMTSADWLMLVLAIYFHDVGMLVTKDEFERRSESSFPAFAANALSGSSGASLDSRLRALGDHSREAYLYQEFVREHHADRVRCWITGSQASEFGVTTQQLQIVSELLDGLHERFRDDLALVCESHHRDDLDDLDRYLVSRPYGQSDAEVANLQYASLMLRTADLLHMTSDRTPSVTHRIINPADPLSQDEWAKQKAVLSVRPKPVTTESGDIDPDAQPSVIEVHADFSDEAGFFGLSQFLVYVRGQLRRSAEWAETARRKRASQHHFPWIAVDDTHISTRGFLKETFSFDLDQDKILDLLTGHTLYNDPTVVVRELIQNSLDAVRLYGYSDGRGEVDYKGRVKVHWDSASRVLTVLDNGTGMTEDIIRKHLLMVGSSRYQDPQFRERFPDFNSISRFGIGVLAAFMVADSVDITTFAANDEEGRKLSLRSVHSRYLVKLLDKATSPEAQRIGNHGTEFVLRVRESAQFDDLLEQVDKWIVLPGCAVEVSVNDGPPRTVGSDTMSAALRHSLAKLDIALPANPDHFCIFEYTEGPVTVALGATWSNHLKEWQVLEVNEAIAQENYESAFGVCVEGVRVLPGTPGYDGLPLAAIANATGPRAPKTNVARSGIEAGPIRDELFHSIYRIYARHISEQIDALKISHGFSETWAANEGRWLLRPFFPIRDTRRDTAEPTDVSIAVKEASRIPLIMAEENGIRSAISPSELCEAPAFWTIEAALFDSLNSMLKEIPGTTSVSSLASIFSEDAFVLPDDAPVLTNLLIGDDVESQALSNKEVGEIVIDQARRRLDLKWVPLESTPKWKQIRFDGVTRFAPYPRRNVLVATAPLPISGVSDEVGFRFADRIHLLHGTALADYLHTFIERLDDRSESHSADVLRAARATVGQTVNRLEHVIAGRATDELSTLEDIIERSIREVSPSPAFALELREFIDFPHFLKAASAQPVIIFSASRWRRSLGGEDPSWW